MGWLVLAAVILYFVTPMPPETLLIILLALAAVWVIKKVVLAVSKTVKQTSKERLAAQSIVALAILFYFVYLHIGDVRIFTTPALIIASILVLIGVVLVLRKFIFWKQHQRPLTEEEILQLASARRAIYINQHFWFTHTKVGVNPNYRSSLERDGRWDRVNDVKLTSIFSLLAQLLRYKRHEWSVWCVADENAVKWIWANKGPDNEYCYYKGSLLEIVCLLQQSACHTVIHMHNHPHTAERYWNLLRPSETDLNTLKTQSEFWTSQGYNFIDGLCSQGGFIIYGASFSPEYWPPGCSVEDIKAENGISEKQNYKLHKELRNKKDAKIKVK